VKVTGQALQDPPDIAARRGQGNSLQVRQIVRFRGKTRTQMCGCAEVTPSCGEQAEEKNIRAKIFLFFLIFLTN